MKTIVEGKEMVSKLLGKQKLKEMEYRLMKYVLRAECEDGILLHNVITGHLILLDPEESVILEQLPKSREDTMNSLIESYFLVPLNYDEKATVDNLRKIIRAMDQRKGINAYVILTTTNCNARCYYCYQADYPHINMSAETASRLVDYMIENKGKGQLRLSWFGGEPLVGIERIKQICEELDSRGVEFVSSMISNGYLFDEEIVEMAVTKWKLITIQITLDGTEEIYNRTKSYVAASDNPYSRVLRNIVLLADHGVHVSIRLNLGTNNGEDLNRLLTELAEICLTHEQIGVYVHTLFGNESFMPYKKDSDSGRQYYKTLDKLRRRIIQLGMRKHDLILPSLRFHSCMADINGSVVIYPDGKLFQCEHTAKGDEMGDVYSGITNWENHDKYLKPGIGIGCVECPLYPYCLILSECSAWLDRNPVYCSYEVSLSADTILHHYLQGC